MGMASGNRWYMPASPTAGSLVRYLLERGGGHVDAFLRDTLGRLAGLQDGFVRSTGLRQRLANAFGEDNATSRCAHSHGFRVAFAPSLMMINREPSDVKSLSNTFKPMPASSSPHTGRVVAATPPS